MDSGQWTVGSGLLTVNGWAVNSKQWAICTKQWVVGRQWTVRSGPCVKFLLAIFGSFIKYSLYFASKYSLEAKIRFRANSFLIYNVLIRFDANQANKAILFASKRINIRFIFAYIRFESNMSGAPYSLSHSLTIPLHRFTAALNVSCLIAQLS